MTGTTGFIGPHVMERLLADGHELSCLVRPGKAYVPVPGVRYCTGTLDDPASLKPLLEGAQTVVHLAALTRARTEAEFQAVNCDSVERLIDMAKAVSPAFDHIVAMSSLAAVGPSCDCRGVCEDEPPRPLTPYGRSKAALEAMLRRRQGEVSWTALRAPAVYGPGDRDFLEYFKLVLKGWRFVVGKRNVMSLVYAKNLADAVALCVDAPAARNEAFFVADEGCYDWDDIGTMIERALGTKARRVRVPFWGVWLASLFSSALAPFCRKPPLLNKHKLAEMSQEFWVVSTDKAAKALGYVPRWATGEAFRITAEWYRENGWL